MATRALSISRPQTWLHVLLCSLLLGLLGACGEVISSGNGDSADDSPPLLTPIVQSFKLDDMSSGDVLLTPADNRDTLPISTTIVAATSATLEIRAATFLAAGTLTPEARCDVLPLPLNTSADGDEASVSQQSFSWHVANLPNGIYRFNVSVSDASGNRSEVQPNVTLLRVGFTGVVSCPLTP
ncbi:MAG: hypothetical protein AAF267_09620 [Deinococcota bacterium]